MFLNQPFTYLWLQRGLLSALLCTVPVLGDAQAATQTAKAKAVKTKIKTQALKAQAMTKKTNPKKAKVEAPIHKAAPRGSWILQCNGGGWKADVLPKWINGSIDGKKVGMPITSKSQLHGKRNKVALKTVVNGAGAGSRISLTLRYTKACRGMPFQARGSFNGRSIAGCCRSSKAR